ncbi:Benzoate 4-monooxygenase [Lasiodiplodia hormozganensis]|uniref:Benzoate 4-monooxygenase n=1 Tax=Lasiodiplodia hormozganensis TaxID=869390 RepID=A0AA40CHF8_9PEZI|nr:Benzoate 4-monooxygenase [Lasiodiplodia hormozganensis]
MILQLVAAVVAYLIFLHPFVSYFADRKNLRQFPSPSFAAVSSLWRISHNLRLSHYQAIDRAHRDLGTHVRIAPNHISISDPAAMQQIYGHGANFLKDGWYDGGAGEFRNISDARDKAQHQERRKMLAHVFAQKTIVQLEPIVAETVATLAKQVDMHAVEGRDINIRRYLNYFTIDFFSRLVWGWTQGCLERGNDVVCAETTDGKLYTVDFIKALHDATIINTLLSFEAPLLKVTKKLAAYHPYTKSGDDWGNMIYHNTKKRLQEGDAGDDIFSKLLTNSKGESNNLPLGAILSECAVMMNGGTDTTTAAMTNTIYLLYKHPDVLAKLREELDPAFGPEELPRYEVVSRLPFLRACIEESLRLRPASTFGLPRLVPSGGREIAGRFIAEGVTVSVPTYTLLHNEDIFGHPYKFWPQRWIDGDKERMSKGHFPFSTGPRACIGRNIAYFEQTLVISTLVRRFEFEFLSPDFKLRTLERFNSNPDELVVRCKKRTGV